MQGADFVHLHVHSDYSLLDGACKVDKLAGAAKDHGMRALALTDHGNMFGTIPFYYAVRAAGVKPIIGFEAYVAPRSRFDREVGAGRDESAYHHLTLLARNDKGYHNLIKLSTAGYLEGFYYKPRIDKDLLKEHAHGLLGASACLGGEIPSLILRDRYDEARSVAAFYRDLFGPEHFYLEVMDHGLPEQRKVIEGLVKLSQDVGVELIATNDVHYLGADDALAHEVLLCINTGKFLEDDSRLSFQTKEYYFKSAEEMAHLFRHLPKALTNTVKAADLCNLEFFFDEKHLPKFAAVEDLDNDAYFLKLCREGLRIRYGEDPPQAAVDRMELETGIVRRMGFVSFFLVAWDLVKKAREIGVPVGPGRGSAAGSIVSYCLEITNIDPLKYELLFERFMSEKRNEAPDIDIDFCQEGRERVLDYVRDKYGRDNIAQIITFGTMGARAVIRDVSRVLQYPLDLTDRLAKTLPAGLNVTLDSALVDSPDFANAYNSDPQVHRVVDIARRLEGLARHASTHAAGLVLADRPLIEYVPLARMQEEVVTQFDMSSLEKAGLVKIDFLGLKTLTVLERAVRTIEARHGVEIDLDALDLDDAPVYRMLGRGEGMGVFQMESGGFRDLLKRLKPDRFTDLIALVALYRPGPLGGGMVDEYVDRKHGRTPIQYPHPVMEEILEPTYGVMVYQEQVMQIVNRLGGVEMSDAYALVKAISKKRTDFIAAKQEEFVEGAVRNGLDRRKAEDVFEQIKYFGGYGFNRSHSTAYAMIAFQTAYLKCHYRAEFMAALMTHEMGDADKLKVYVEECRKGMGIDILPPDVNESESGFTVLDEGIRFGLEGVKGVGGKAADSIAAARAKEGPFKSLFDLCSRVDLRVTNRAVIDALVNCGAFDSLGGKRSQYSAVLDKALTAGQRIQADQQAGQSTFFDQFAAAVPTAEAGENLPNVPEWSEQQLLEHEKSTIGFYLTNHPVARHSDVLSQFANVTTDGLRKMEDGTEVTLGVMITQLKYTVARNGRSKGERMAMMNLEDLTGVCDGVLFPRDLARNEGTLQPEAVVFVRGKLNLRREPPSIAISEVIPVEEAPRRLTESVTIRLDPRHQETRVMERLRQVLSEHSGGCTVYLQIAAPDKSTRLVRADSSFCVTPDKAFAEDVGDVLGGGCLTFNAIGPRMKPDRQNGGRNWPRN